MLEKQERVQLDRGLSGANWTTELQPGGLQVAATSFVVLFCIVGLALWGLSFYYDFMVQQFGWTRAQVTSGNALSKLVVGPVFGFIAGWIIDRLQARARDNGRDPGEPLYANGRRFVRWAAGQPAHGSANCGEYSVGGTDHGED